MARTIRTCSAALAVALVAAFALPAAAAPGDLAAYLRARVADADGAVDEAARGYAIALAAAPADSEVALRAWREALVAGDDALATRALATLAATNARPIDAPLIEIATAARAHDAAAAAAAVARLDGTPLGMLAPSLRAWAALEAGGDPLAPLAIPATDPLARRFADETRVLQLIATGRADEARARLPAGVSPELLDIRAKPSLAFGASWLFTRVAADLANVESGPLSITLTRAALIADPANGRAHILLAGALARQGPPTRALAELDRVAADSAQAETARAARIAILEAGGDMPAALAFARAVAARPDADADDRRRLAGLLLKSGSPAEAVPLYRALTEGAGARDWTAWLQLGSALDEAGRWPEARDALERAVALAPNEPVVLNYLGYGSLVHGGDAAKARTMIERASALAPDNAAITDSLGWAWYVAGQPARALPLLERAVVADPATGEIGEHLGDTYWALGRRYEARYAWRAAALGSEAEDLARLTGKIASGLPERQ